MLKIFNTLTGKKELFQPLNDRTIKIYVCGPTVYDYCHIGHARAGLSFDVIRRYLEWRFPEKRIVFIINFTDIDDKMINRANQEGITIFELADRFIAQYFKDFDALNVKRASFYPRATEHISDMITFIQKLIERGFAYEDEGNVYFSIEPFKSYGKLSHKKLEELPPDQETAAFKKRNPNDFALWKQRKEKEPYWDSPWGPGRPGWHIECSTMSMKYLGESLDIHGGGLDLIFPHHENEIAQSEALTGKSFVNFWIHNGFVLINNEKMSKSLGNFLTIEEILQKYHPMVLRFFLLSTHYRSPINFEEQHLMQAQQAYNKVHLALAYARQEYADLPISEALSAELAEQLQKVKREFIEAMDDDFSTPKAVAAINGFVKYLNGIASLKERAQSETQHHAYETLRELCHVLGLVKSPEEDEQEQLITKLMKMLLELRDDARNRKQYEISDRIRAKLKEFGITLLDYPNKTIWFQE